MRKVILNLAVSLDGFIEGPNGEYDWCFADQDYGMSAFFEGIDTVFMGRKSYDLIVTAGDPDVFPELTKYIFSDTLTHPQLNNAQVIGKADFIQKVKSIKDETGRSIWLFGGGDLISSFLNAGLIDQFILSVHPVLLGGGKVLFKDLTKRLDLMHLDTISYPGGLVQLTYIPKPKFDLSAVPGAGY